MMAINESHLFEERGIRSVARALSIVWVLCWIVFGFISGIGEGLGAGGVVSHTTLPGFIILVSVAIAWKREGLGGALIMVEGILITIYFLTQLDSISLLGMAFVIMYATIPSFLVSAMFLYNWRLVRHHQAEGKTI
jgi:hypothetical protein